MFVSTYAVPAVTGAIPGTFPQIDNVTYVDYTLSQEYRAYDTSEVKNTSGYSRYIVENLTAQGLAGNLKIQYHANLPVWTTTCTEPESRDFRQNMTVDSNRLITHIADYGDPDIGWTDGKYHAELYVRTPIAVGETQDRRDEFVALRRKDPVDFAFKYVEETTLQIGGKSVDAMKFTHTSPTYYYHH
ncbi:MAG: hypothetical protein ACTSU5_18165 [Promethearchaeota archaeon]